MFKKYRKKAKLTQEQLAEKLELSWRQVQRIETGKNDPSLKTFSKMIKILKISDKDILSYLKKKHNEEKKKQQ